MAIEKVLPKSQNIYVKFSLVNLWLWNSSMNKIFFSVFLWPIHQFEEESLVLFYYRIKINTLVDIFIVYVCGLHVFVHLYILWCSPPSNMHNTLNCELLFFTRITMQFLQSSAIWWSHSQEEDCNANILDDCHFCLFVSKEILWKLQKCLYPSLNTQSCIRGLLVVRDFCFWAG